MNNFIKTGLHFASVLRIKVELGVAMLFLLFWRIKRPIIERYDATALVSIEDLCLSEENVERIRKRHCSDRIVILAEIDQDGRYLSQVGDIPIVPTVSMEDFLPRDKYVLQLVSDDCLVEIKKYFNGRVKEFVREARALRTLGGIGVNVPKLIEIDVRNLSISFSFIPGDVLREAMALKGALVRDCDVRDHESFRNLSRREAAEKRIREGKRVLNDIVDDEFVDALFKELHKIHWARFFLRDIKYGNIIIEKFTNKPFFIDFETASRYWYIPERYFALLIRRNMEKFNYLFNRNN